MRKADELLEKVNSPLYKSYKVWDLVTQIISCKEVLEHFGLEVKIFQHGKELEQ